MIPRTQVPVCGNVEVPRLQSRAEWKIPSFVKQVEQNNSGDIDTLPNKTASQLFEECVKNFGERTAIILGDQRLTYNELNVKANQLANYLRKVGVGPNILVAVCFERSLDFIISILAIVKAGGMYLPLDSSDPANRMRDILQDSNPVRILTNKIMCDSLHEALGANAENKIVRVDAFFQDEVETNVENPPCLNTLRDPIYVMYTSGSTGKPKGCIIPHRGVVRLVKDTNYVQIDHTDTVAQIANAGFDAVTFELWGALLNGACLHIIPRTTLLSFLDFSKALKDNHITILLITTSLLNLVVRDCPSAFDQVKYLLFGGEKANVEIIKTLLGRKKKCRLMDLHIINLYGPTESTTAATAFLVTKLADIKKNVPIGKPISNTQTYILDKNMKFVPPGVIGELYLGGDGLALGYLNNPKKTAAAFVQCPWKTWEKIYKTGDLVYWTPELGIVFVGRIDSQVKINGFRVELGDVEACIVKNRVVKQAHVVAQTDAEERKQLIAYVVFYREQAINFTQFHQYLKENLPYYMIPSKVIQVDYLPLTSTGKIDKEQLTKMAGKNILEIATNGPNNRMEEIIVEVWKSLLGISHVGINHNFFDLGAHSLMLSEASVLINAKIGSNIINVLDILTHPTAHLLSDYINNKGKGKADILEIPTEIGSRRRQIVTLLARKRLHAIR